MTEKRATTSTEAMQAVYDAAGLNDQSSRYYTLRDAVNNLLTLHASELAGRLRAEIRNATGAGREDWAALVREVDRLVDTIDPRVVTS